MALTKIPASLLDKSSNVDFADDEKLRFGGGNDLQIYHDGTDSWIYNTTGALNIRQANGGNINLQPYGGENAIIAKPKFPAYP